MNFLWVYGSAFLACLCCIWAFWQGGRVEKYAAAIIFVAWVLSSLLQSHNGKGPGIWVELIDIVVLILFAALSLWSRRIWTLFITACQLDAVASHLVAHLTHFGVFSYLTATGLWGGEGLLIALAFGIVGYQKQQKLERRLTS